MADLPEGLQEAVAAAVAADPGLQSYIDVELRADMERRAAWREDSHRYRGASMSGFGPGPYKGRSAFDLILAAARQKQAFAAWSETPEARVHQQVTRAEQLLLALSHTVMEAHSAYDRGLSHAANHAAFSLRLNEALSASQKLSQAIVGAVEAAGQVAKLPLQAAE